MPNNKNAPFIAVTARVAGVLYLIIIITGIFAEFFVRQRLIDPGNAVATAGKIMASEWLFRVGIGADLMMIICDVALALLFYLLLKPVNRSLSMLAAFFRLIQAAVLAVNMLNLVFVLNFLSGADYLAVFNNGQLPALALLFLQTHGIGYSIGLVFFAIHCFILGYLLFKSGYFPKILGILLIIAGSGYLIDSFARVLLSNYANYENILTLVVFIPAFVGELSLCLWLIVRGARVPQTKETI